MDITKCRIPKPEVKMRKDSLDSELLWCKSGRWVDLGGKNLPTGAENISPEEECLTLVETAPTVSFLTAPRKGWRRCEDSMDLGLRLPGMDTPHEYALSLSSLQATFLPRVMGSQRWK